MCHPSQSEQFHFLSEISELLFLSFWNKSCCDGTMPFVSSNPGFHISWNRLLVYFSRLEVSDWTYLSNIHPSHDPCVGKPLDNMWWMNAEKWMNEWKRGEGYVEPSRKGGEGTMTRRIYPASWDLSWGWPHAVVNDILPHSGNVLFKLQCVINVDIEPLT